MPNCSIILEDFYMTIDSAFVSHPSGIVAAIDQRFDKLLTTFFNFFLMPGKLFVAFFTEYFLSTIFLKSSCKEQKQKPGL